MNYRRKSKLRLANYDYNNNGYYFVTICTKHRINWFGDIEKQTMILNKCGQIISKKWNKIPQIYKNITLDCCVIMPNHIHGIIVIENNDYHVGAEHCSAPTNTQQSNDLFTNRNHGLISRIIQSFKGICTKQIYSQLNNYDFAWQRSFYDHIIRNGKSLGSIRNYIKNNPLKWEYDRNYMS